jgi:hypothetical protein
MLDGFPVKRYRYSGHSDSPAWARANPLTGGNKASSQSDTGSLVYHHDCFTDLVPK